MLGAALIFLNIVAIARGDTRRAPELTLCQSTQGTSCVLPTLTYEFVARDLGRKTVYRLSWDRPSLHAIIEAMDANRLRPFPTIAPPRTARLFNQERATAHGFMYFGQEANEFEREKPLSIYPYQTIIDTSHKARSALLHIKQAF